MNATLDAALGYAARGFPVFPLNPNSKEPHGLLAPNGHLNATVNLDTIRRWWTRSPDANIGIAVPDHLVVVDIDPRNGGDVTWNELANGRTVDTLTSISGRGDGGFHLWLNRPDIKLNTKLGPGVDVKAGGKGYIVAPPSIHPDTGLPYTWADEGDTTNPPEWLIHPLTKQEPPAPIVNPTIPKREYGTNPINADDIRPGDQFTATTTWDQLLTADGWTPVEQHGTEYRWRRPGKTTGISAVVNHTGTDRLKVFTSSVPGLDDNGTYDRFGYWAATRHNGDHTAAATDLAQLGYGTGSYTPDVSYIEQPQQRPIIPANVNPDTGEIIDDGNWDDPIPLGMAPKNLPSFPVEVFPSWLANQIQAVADDIQVPIDLPATIALAALATITSKRVEVAADAWVAQTNLYLVVASPPGQGKSPVFAAMTSCLERLQANLAQALGPTIAKAEMEHRIAEKQARKAEEKGDLDTAWQHTQTAMEIHIPKPPRLIADDATPEALTRLLADNNGRMAIMSSEGGVFDMMTGKYSDQANLEVYLKGWSADTIQVDRIHREPEHVDKATITIGLTVQPMVIQRLANKPELAGRGLTARFMYALPPSNVGHRDMTQRRADRTTQQHAYDTKLIDLYTQLAAYQTPGKLSLTDHDVDKFNHWRQTIEQRRKEGGDLRALAEWTTKLERSVLSLCGLLHIAYGGTHHGTIDEGVLDLAIIVADYWIEHSYAVHDLWGTDDTLAGARIILAWAHRENASTFTASEVHKKLRSQFDRIADVADPLALLVERGWVRPMFQGPMKLGVRGKDSPAFAVHPTARPVDNRTGSGVVVREWCTTAPADPPVVSHSRHVRKGLSEELTPLLETPQGKAPPAHDANDTQPDETDPNDPLNGYGLF